jgi:hypothetical protein
VQKKICPKLASDPSYGGARRYHYDCDLEKLYNLSADPSEQHNIISEHPEIADLMRERISHYLKHRPPQQPMRLQMHMSEVCHFFVRFPSIILIFVVT